MLEGFVMQNFFVAAADTMKPFFIGFQNPFTALLRSHGGSQPADERVQSLRDMEQLARNVERMQPGLAAELRSIAARA
jgi:hypothetical protein